MVVTEKQKKFHNPIKNPYNAITLDYIKLTNLSGVKIT